MTIRIDRIRWNRRYSDPSYTPNWAPDIALASNLSKLPKGKALDLACGTGANSIFLAKRGYFIDALDISDVGLEIMRRAAVSEGLADRIMPVLSDIEEYSLEEQAYDLIICFRFFISELALKIIPALKPGGMVLCRSYTRDHLKYRPDWSFERLMDPEELIEVFSGFDVLLCQKKDEDDDAHVVFLGRKPPK